MLSTDGGILVVLFAEPPFAPLPPGDSGNKISWAAKDPLGGGLTVDAHLVGTPEAVEIGEIFLGRSFVNVPKPGVLALDAAFDAALVRAGRDHRHRLPRQRMRTGDNVTGGAVTRILGMCVGA